MIVNLENAVHLFQVALTPAFLLTGSSALLGILSSRLSGLLEKSRSLNQLIKDRADQSFDNELALLDRCCILQYRSFVSCQFSIFCTCLVITFLFTGQFIPVEYANGVAVSVCFTLAMICLSISVFLFIYETLIGKRLLFFITKLNHESD